MLTNAFLLYSAVLVAFTHPRRNGHGRGLAALYWLTVFASLSLLGMAIAAAQYGMEMP